MVMPVEKAYLIPLLPLIAFTINILLGKHVKHKAALISIAASLGSCAVAWPLIWQVSQGATLRHEFAFLALGSHPLNFGILIDPPAATLLLVVTLIGTLIQIYSSGYMHDEPRFSRFFAYLSLFMAAMLMLVIANNYLQFFMSWEVMGLCSYLLIGFYSEKNSAANASKKAFLTTRIGDVGFFLGILALFSAIGTLDFTHMHEAVHANASSTLLPAAALLIFCGTVGKSAQFPLHVWLPDAMEGPTPVSALIHAATMVAAGVYLVARSFVLLEVFPQVMPVIAVIGTITAFMAAFIALTATDIKKVLAYSTISQLGFMVTAMGLGSMTAGLFHLMTHAFFKALLFLGAGSVIHGTGTQDIREMGGLFGKMKSTAFTFLIASLAIAGVPPLAGFWSKDEILLAAHDSGNQIIYIVLGVTAFMTAFYMFRLFILTFLGKPRNSHIHAHESPVSMTGPLWVLALGSIVIGLPGSPFLGHWFQNFLEGGHAEAHVNMTVMISSIAIGLGGIILAAIIYGGGLGLAEKLAKAFGPLYTASVNKLWFDELYAAFIVKPFQALGGLLFKFDAGVIDGIVNGVGRLTMKKSALSGLFDKYVVDGLVNLVGYTTQLFSSVLRKIQSGLVQNYLLILFSGLVILLYLGAR